MKKKQLFFIPVLLVLVSLLLVACKDKTAATVNGKPIMQSEIDKQINLIKSQQPQAFEGPQGKKVEKNFRQGILDSLITQELIRQEAEKEKVTVSEKEVNDKIEQIKKIFPEEQKFEEALKQQNMTLEDLKARVHDRTLAEKMLKKVTGDIKVTEEEMKKFYQENQAQFQDPEQIHARHILLKTAEEGDKTLKELKSGANFEEKAKELSSDTATKEAGGDLGWRRKQEFPPEVAPAFDNLQPGQLSEVIKAQDGFHIYKLEEKKAARQKSFEEVKGQVEQQLLSQKQQTKFLNWVEGLKKKAKIDKNV